MGGPTDRAFFFEAPASLLHKRTESTLNLEDKTKQTAGYSFSHSPVGQQSGWTTDLTEVQTARSPARSGQSPATTLLFGRFSQICVAAPESSLIFGQAMDLDKHHSLSHTCFLRLWSAESQGSGASQGHRFSPAGHKKHRQKLCRFNWKIQPMKIHLQDYKGLRAPRYTPASVIKISVTFISSVCSWAC